MALSILHTESSLGWGGQEIRVLTEAAALAKRGHRVVLAAPESAQIFKAAPRYGLPVQVIPMEKKRIGGLLAAKRFIQSESFDVINTHSSTDAWLFALACSLIGKSAPPIVRTRHISSPIPDNFASRWLYAKSTAHIATTGEALREQVISSMRVAPERVSNVPTGIDLERFCRRDKVQARAAVGLPSEATIIGIVATLRGWKGHRYLLDAVASLTRPDIHLVIVGDGPQREALETQVVELKLQHAVTFTGNRDDVQLWMSSFDLFCLPSYANEGVPQALMQAMACGLPVITTPVGAIGEIVKHQQTGIMIEPQNSTALAAAIITLLTSEEIRSTISNGAFDFAQSRFGVHVMADRMEKIFNSVVANRTH